MSAYAVLTGDLVESSRINDGLRAELLAWLRELASDFADLHNGASTGELAVFRGDSWQLCLSRPELAVEAAVFLRAGLKAHQSRENLDTRVGIGIGEAEAVNPRRISESSGPAFISSGKALDSLKGSDLRMRIDWREAGLAARAFCDAAVPLLDLHISQWTQPESAAVCGTLLGKTQEDVAELPISAKKDGSKPSRQSVSDALARIRWSSHMQPSLTMISNLIREEIAS